MLGTSYIKLLGSLSIGVTSDEVVAATDSSSEIVTDSIAPFAILIKFTYFSPFG
ncbi:MAG: hypothetical protein R3Y22_06515 [Bacteroidales bacterium]